MQACGPVKTGVITNPRSRANRRGFADISAVLARRAGVVHHVLEEFADLPAVLREFAQAQVGLVAINGGDGTVQATLSELLREPVRGPLPLLGVLAGGTTNAIANDVGGRGRRAAVLARLIEQGRGGVDPTLVTARHVIALRRAPGERVRYGMLFGSAGISRGIALRRALIPQIWVPDALANAAVVAGLALGWSLGLAFARRVFEGEPVGVGFDGEQPVPGHHVIVLVTTLQRLVLGMRPFWGTGPGGLQYTSIAYPPRALLGNLRRLLYGDRQRRLPAGYLSRKADAISLRLSCPFVLDGEFYEPAPGQPVELRAGPRVGFLRC